MNIKDLMKSVDFENLRPLLALHNDCNIDACHHTYDAICAIHPTFDFFELFVEVKKLNNRIVVSNTHLGSLSDIAGRRFHADSQLSDNEVAANVIFHLTANSYDADAYNDALSYTDDDMMNPQTAKVVR